MPLTWGTYGKSGKEPLRYININDMSTNHILNVLKTQINIDSHYYHAFIDILYKRNIKSFYQKPWKYTTEK